MQERFTVSEVVLMGWRSQEQTYQMKQRMKQGQTEPEVGEERVTRSKASPYGTNDIIPEGLPDRFYDEEGQVNLSKVKFKDAITYMGKIGMKFPVPSKTKKGGVQRDVDKLPSMDEICGDS